MNNFNSSRVLITGGAGFVGSNLAHKLVSQGHRVLCVDNLSTGHAENVMHLERLDNFEFMKMDICSDAFTNNMKKRQSQKPFDKIFHLACPTGVPNIVTLGEAMLQACSTGTNNVLRCAKDHGAELVFTSSCEVYGNPLEFPQKENYHGSVDPIGPRSAYEEGKRFSEALVKLYVDQHGVKARTVRIFNTYGPGMSLADQRVIPQFVYKTLTDEPIVIYGDGSQTRTFLYIADLLDGLIKVMKKGDAGMVYNIGGHTQFTIKQLSKKLSDQFSIRPEIIFKPHFIEDHTARQPDTSRVRDLGWQPKVKLDDGLKRTIQNFTQRLPQELETAVG